MSDLRQCAEYFYKQLLFRSYNQADGFLELREFGHGRAQSHWFQSIDELINMAHARDDIYHGLLVRNQRKGTKAQAVYSDMICLDIDAHSTGYGDADIENCKLLAYESVKSDYILSQYAAIIDSGRGLHVYYLSPGKVYKESWSIYQKRLIQYAKSVNQILGYELRKEEGKLIEERVDSKVHDAPRVFRALNSINMKNRRQCHVLEFNPVIYNDSFQSMLNIDNSKRKASIGVAKAMELLKIVPDPSKNVSCYFPHHDDTRHSFRYYPDSDTYWCFKCENGISGIDFLKAMGRDDLCGSLRAVCDIRKIDNYRLCNEGNMWQEDKDGSEKIICRFQTPHMIEQTSITKGRRLYAAFKDDAIELTDLPMNRELKRRYLQMGKTGFLSTVTDGRLPEVLVRFIEIADKVERVVSEDNGINNFDGRDPMFRFNEKIFPEGGSDDVIMVPNKIGSHTVNAAPDFDLNQFISWLIADGNYTHIVALLWGISLTARDIFIDKCGLFPLLVATGIREAGKTLMAKMVCSMFGYDTSEEMDTTPFAMIKKLERYGTLPVHFDEYGGKKKEQDHEEIIKDLSTNKYITRERGNLARGTDKYIIQAPIIITGERNVLDAGMVSRSIIFNIGKNRRKDQVAFMKWIDAVKKFKLNTFMERFMVDWKSYRKYVENLSMSRNRDEVKCDIIFKTLDYLLQEGYIKEGLIDRDKISEVLTVTKQYKDATSPDDYTEILTEALNISYRHDIGEISTNYYLQQANKAIRFDIKNSVVCINVSELHNLYKWNTKDARSPLTKLKAFKTALLQAPDFLFSYTRKYCKFLAYDKTETDGRLTEPIFINVSGYNVELLRIPLMVKLRPLVIDQHELEQVVDKTLEDMLNTEIDIRNVQFNHRHKLTLL